MSAAWLETCALHYLAGTDPASPLASPLFAKLRDLPPTLIQTGTDDILHGDALRLQEALASADVEVRCETVPARWHVFQLHAGVLPSATMAVARAGEFASQNIATTS
jgi:acetyl esterase/lipase